MEEFRFFLEVLLSGLLAGIMYSLIALGFVLIYKVSGVFNYAQGAQVLFAALTFVSLFERGIPMWGAFVVSLAIMVLLGIAIERIVMRPLVAGAQTQMTLFMAAIGLSYIIEGGAQLIWGTEVHGLDIGIDDVPIDIGGVSVSRFELFAAAIAALMVGSLTAFFSYTRMGLAFRAVAQDQLASLSMGLRLSRIWAAVWAVSGIIALVAGILWGTRLGVQFSLSLVVLKALPVLVLGGFDSIAGAIVGGLIIGATEKLAEIYIGPFLGQGIEGWFAYAAALAFLMVRPSGLFGQRVIERM